MGCDAGKDVNKLMGQSTEKTPPRASREEEMTSPESMHRSRTVLSKVRSNLAAVRSSTYKDLTAAVREESGRDGCERCARTCRYDQREGR